MSEPKKPVGRPRKHYGKRSTFTFRVTDDMRTKLQAAANADGRAVSEIIEARLERSFLLDEMRQIIREESAAYRPQQPPNLVWPRPDTPREQWLTLATGINGPDQAA